MKKLAILVVIVSILSGCITEKRCNRKYPPTQIDSVYINNYTYVHDTTVIFSIQSDTVWAVTPDWQPSVLSNKYCVSTAYVRADSLYHTLMLTGQDVPITIKDAIKYVTLTKYRDRTVIKQVKFIPRFYKIMSWFGIGAFVLFLLFVITKFTF